MTTKALRSDTMFENFREKESKGPGDARDEDPGKASEGASAIVLEYKERA